MMYQEKLKRQKIELGNWGNLVQLDILQLKPPTRRKRCSPKESKFNGNEAIWPGRKGKESALVMQDPQRVSDRPATHAM